MDWRGGVNNYVGLHLSSMEIKELVTNKSGDD